MPVGHPRLGIRRHQKADQVPSAATCPANTVAESDRPANFKKNSTLLCGMSWPQDTPFTNFSSCCAGPVQVNNGCFQYCTPSNGSTFSSCLVRHVNYSGALDIVCNQDTAVSSGAAGRLVGLDGSLVGGFALLAVLVRLIL